MEKYIVPEMVVIEMDLKLLLLGSPYQVILNNDDKIISIEEFI